MRFDVVIGFDKGQPLNQRVRNARIVDQDNTLRLVGELVGDEVDRLPEELSVLHKTDFKLLNSCLMVEGFQGGWSAMYRQEWHLYPPSSDQQGG